MYLTGLIHRERLFNIATRWLADEMHPNDGELATEIFVYESLISGPTISRFLGDIHRTLTKEPLSFCAVHSKDEVRKILCEAYEQSPQSNAHCRELLENYKRNTEEFFPRMPVDLFTVHRGGMLAGMSRIKRVRRIAEKAARRIADRLAGVINDRAVQFASERARAAGVPLEHFYSTQEEMRRDFENAERDVAQAFRGFPNFFQPEDLHIDDIIGSKFVGPPEELERVEKAIAAHPKAHLVERQVHSGRYNATNLLIDFELPSPGEIVDRMKDFDWSPAACRGLSVERLASGFPAYVESGKRTVRSEVILTTLDELIESEFGRSLHEERIVRQREFAQYSGRIAKNASDIIEFLMMLAISPSISVPEIPVKMWGRYLPDTLSWAVWHLFGDSRSYGLFDSFVQSPKQIQRGALPPTVMPVSIPPVEDEANAELASGRTFQESLNKIRELI